MIPNALLFDRWSLNIIEWLLWSFRYCWSDRFCMILVCIVTFLYSRVLVLVLLFSFIVFIVCYGVLLFHTRFWSFYRYLAVIVVVIFSAPLKSCHVLRKNFESQGRAPFRCAGRDTAGGPITHMPAARDYRDRTSTGCCCLLPVTRLMWSYYVRSPLNFILGVVHG